MMSNQRSLFSYFFLIIFKPFIFKPFKPFIYNFSYYFKGYFVHDERSSVHWKGANYGSALPRRSRPPDLPAATLGRRAPTRAPPGPLQDRVGTNSQRAIPLAQGPPPRQVHGRATDEDPQPRWPARPNPQAFPAPSLAGFILPGKNLDCEIWIRKWSIFLISQIRHNFEYISYISFKLCS